MKTKRYTSFLTAALLLLGGLFASQEFSMAQSTQNRQTFESFTGISVSNDFVVTLNEGREYSATITVDEAFMPYVVCQVKNRTLTVAMNKVPRDVRKKFKGRNAPKVSFNVTITTPTLGEISLNDNAVLMSTTPFAAGDLFINMLGKSQIKHLEVDAGNSATISMAKNTMADLKISADLLNVSTVGSSSLRLVFDTAGLNLTAKNNAILVAMGDTDALSLTADGSSKVTLSGTAAQPFEATCGGSCSVDALNMAVRKAIVVMTGGTLIEAASDFLSMDLSGRSTLIFDKTPEISIQSIKTSTVTPYSMR